jgi:hypothetical protein
MSEKGRSIIFTFVGITCILLIAFIVTPPNFPQGEDETPPVTLIGSYNETADEYNIIYSGTYRSDIVYFASDVTVKHNGKAETWNGETRGQTVPVGSEHTIEVSNETEPISVTFRHEVHGNTTVTLQI